MTKKAKYGLLAFIVLLGNMMPANGKNLLSNGSFETYNCGSLGCSFSDWSLPLGSGTPNTEDKIDGEVSLMVDATFTSTLDNEVLLSDDYYNAGTEFKITIPYKVITMPENMSLQLDCYWEPAPGGDAESMKQHDADKLQFAFADGVTANWEKIETATTKPAKSSRLRVRVVVPKDAAVLLDSIGVEGPEVSPDAPYITFSPLHLSPVSVESGKSVSFTTLHIEQGNLTGTTKFGLVGYDSKMFQLSSTTMPSSTSALDLVITYEPTESGSHSAVLTIDNPDYPVLFQSVSLNGTCIDPSKKPSITAQPKELGPFKAVEGKEQRDTFTVISENCTDYVYLRMDHIKGSAFTIDGSMIGKNAKTDVHVRFAPQEPGEYESKITIYSEGVEDIVMTLKGTGIKRDAGNIDWQTDFIWDDSHPQILVNETFDNVDHNSTIVLEGWQNVAAVEARPWWGFDESKTSPARGTNKYAKATAYQYGKASSGDWEMWLVTPALDYKNAGSKIFTFSIMGEYLQEEGGPTQLEVYYIDATGKEVFFQDLTESFGIPWTSEENGIWLTFYLNLESYAETMADVFHMGFHFKGPNGDKGPVVYYIDDVSWGRTDLPQIQVNPSYLIDSTAIVGERKALTEIEVTGKNLSDEITLWLAGANYNRFELSTTTLPAAGGKVTISFRGLEVGVHEAYVVLSSKDAPDSFFPMSVKCNEVLGIEKTKTDLIRTGKILRDGQIYLIYEGTMYNVQGKVVQKLRIKNYELKHR